MKQDFILEALTEAQIAQSNGDIPVGAVIVDPKNHNIIARGHNQVVKNNDPTAHAEIQAIRHAAQVLGKHRLDGYDIYSSLEPCTMCSATISLSRIRRLYFALEDIKFGAVISNIRYFESHNCHHKTEYYYGFHEEQAQKIIKEFFAKKR